MNERPRTVALGLNGAMAVRTVVAVVREGAERGLRAAGERIAIGTAKDNDLVVADQTVSGYHLRATARRNGVEVVDFGSTNGMRCNSVRIERAVVPAGAA